MRTSLGTFSYHRISLLIRLLLVYLFRIVKVLIPRQSYFFLVCLFSLFTNPLFSQIPANPIGTNPLSLKWSQINTDRVQVIFPKGLEPSAQRVANVIDYLWENNLKSIGQQQKKVTILFQNQTTIPNGFVTVGPFRSEFNMTPPQFNYTTDWLDVLAIHEYRHVQQFGNSENGITKLIKTISGSWAWGGMFGMALPRWYLEGDATGMETALTSSGRGRLPSFDMEYRSLILHNQKYSYEKAAAGSLKDFVPNWYNLGYYMTTYARKEFGQDVWSDVIADAGRYRGIFYPFDKGLKKRTGLSVKDLYQKTMEDLESQWQAKEGEKRQGTGRQINTKTKKTITHYTNPQYLNDETLIVTKSAYNQIPAFIMMGKNGREVKLTEPGIIRDPLNFNLSLSSGKLCWSEIGYDLRWINKNHSNIRQYNLSKKEKIKLSSKAKYFSPAFSNDVKKIVAVEATEDLTYHLVILSADSVELIHKLPNPDNYFYSFPRWMEDNEHIVVVAQKEEGNSLQKIHWETGVTETLTSPSNQQISHPFPKGDYIYFSGTYTGINNIFALHVEDKSLFQLTSSPLGAFHPSVSLSGKKLAYSEFHPQGYNIIEIDLDQTQWQVYSLDQPSSLQYYKILEEQEGGSIFEKVGNKEFDINKFNKWSGIVNFHSWLPFIEPPTFGARVLSDNKFGTLAMEAGAFYNVNEKEWTLGANASYAELFPVINTRYLLANRSSVIYNFAPANDTTIYANFYVEEWQENSISGGLALPLNLSKGNFFNRLTLRADYKRINLDVEGNFDKPNNARDTSMNGAINVQNLDFIFKEPLQSTVLNAMDVRMVFRSFRRMALQHLNPRLGLNLDLRYRSTFGNDNYQGDVFLGRTDLFLPGFGRNHSLVVNGLYQRQDVLDNYRFSNLFIYPRGYDVVFGDRVFKLGFNYHIPLLYPDLAIGGLAFVKRVKANLFYDQAWLEAEFPFGNTWTQNSAGVELSFDIRAFRLLEIDFGFRYSYVLGNSFLPRGGRNQFDFLLFSISQ